MNEAILFFLGAVLSAYAVIIGGGMFLSAPLFQLLFPGAQLGQIVGAIKVGSTLRGLASTWITWRQVRLRQSLLLAIPFIIGAALGARLIANIDQRWILPLILLAVAMSELAPRLQKLIDRRTFLVTAFLAGLYGGALGAGIGVVIVALLRVLTPDEERIVEVKIEARFVEFIMGLAAIAVHLWAGNLVPAIWLPWGLGSLIGGALGGLVLKRLINVGAGLQRALLLIAYIVALAGALSAFLAHAPS